MKRTTLLLILLFIANISFGQYYMQGRFVNTAPDSTSLDSVAFEFTSTTYQYFINAGTVPSSAGTYSVITGGTYDSLVLTEDTLGVCNTNGGGSIVRFRLAYVLSPYHGLTIIETSHSIDSCPSHSYKIQGDYIGYTGQIIFTSAINNTVRPSLQTNIYNGRLNVSSSYNEKISVNIINMNGQKLMKTQDAMLLNGQSAGFDFNGLSPGIYFVIIQSEHERKTLKFVL